MAIQKMEEEAMAKLEHSLECLEGDDAQGAEGHLTQTAHFLAAQMEQV